MIGRSLERDEGGQTPNLLKEFYQKPISLWLMTLGGSIPSPRMIFQKRLNPTLVGKKIKLKLVVVKAPNNLKPTSQTDKITTITLNNPKPNQNQSLTNHF